MVALDACTSFCTALSQTIGPTLTELLMAGALAALVWWRGRKHVATVLAPVVARADAAEAKASAAQLQLAELRGSLRPAALLSPLPPSTPPVIGTSSSQSGNYAPITMPELGEGVPRPRSSLLDPSLSGEDPLPRPSSVPEFEAAKTPVPPRGGRK